MNCLNETDKSTLIKENLSRKFIIDLAFTNKEIENIQWYISKKKSGSDHELIQFEVSVNKKESVLNSLLNDQFNFEKADWKKINKMLVEYQEKEKFKSQSRINSSSTEADMEKEAKVLKNLILYVINQQISKKRSIERSKS
jgi:hypothetical protein